MLARLPCLPLLLSALALPAAAAELSWDLGPEKVRYDRSGEPPEGAPPTVPQLSPFKIVGQTDFDQGRRPRQGVETPLDLVWRYALELPAGDVPKRTKRPFVVEIADTFDVKGGTISAKGNHSVRRKGKAKLRIRTSVVVKCTVKDHWLRKANLVVTRQFNAKKGRLEQAEYTYELLVAHEDAEVPLAFKGRIEPERAVVKVETPAFHAQVQEAIDRGASWLTGAAKDRLIAFKASQDPGRYALGKLALPTFALLRSGVPVKKLENLFAWMHAQPLEDTYSVSLWIMVLEARSIERKAIPPRAHTRSVARYKRAPLPKADKDRIQEAVDWLVKTRKSPAGWWSYFGRIGKDPLGHDHKTVSKGGDRSNSQFAVLALHSALAGGVKVPGKVWEEIYTEVTDHQQHRGPKTSLQGTVWNRSSPLAVDPRDKEVLAPGQTSERKKPIGSLGPERLDGRARGWAYATSRRAKGEEAYGSMSAAGLSTLAIAREGLHHSRRLTGERRVMADEGLRDGTAWFVRNYDNTRNPMRGAQHYYYYVYSFEKAMDTAGIERLGEREWWRDFAAELLARQRDDGSWEGNVHSTSFALLLLNRATLPVQLDVGEVKRVATGERDPSHWDLAVVEGIGQLSVRQLLGVMISAPEEAADKLPMARKALAALPERQRPRLTPELTELLDCEHRPTRRWARESCRLLAGTGDRSQLLAFASGWETLRRASDGKDHALLPDVRKILEAKGSTRPLRAEAIAVIGRLRALEAVGDVIDQLGDDDADYRALVLTYVVSLTGGEHEPFEPRGSKAARKQQLAGWRSWWKKHGPERIQAEQIRRAVADLAVPGREAAAEKALTKIGKPALRTLIDGLRTETSKKRAHKLLKAISGQKLNDQPETWLEWLEGQG